MKQRGFTLIELMVAVAIIGLLAVIAMMSWRRQLDKARDAQRKEHLQKISLAFEEYFSDHDCYYPDPAVLENCGGAGLQPYLDKIPCDPVTGDYYEYIPDENRPACPQNYRLLANLQNEVDPVIAALGCGTAAGCGWGGTPVYDYGVSSKNISLANPALPEASPSTGPAASPSPQPSAPPVIDYYACNLAGLCAYRGTVPPAGCSFYWETSCPVDCADPSYQCGE